MSEPLVSAVRTDACAGRNGAAEDARSPFVVLATEGALAPERLEHRAEVMARNADLDFAVFQPGASSGALGDDLCRFLYLDAPWTSTAVMWRREALLRLGPLHDTPPGWRDLELYVRAITAGCRYARFLDADPAPHQPAERGVEPPESLEPALETIERLEADVRDGPGMNWVRQRALCSLYFDVAERWAERRELPTALAAWRTMRARRLGPPHLHAEGAALLRLRAAGAPVRRTIHAWKNWARLSPFK